MRVSMLYSPARTPLLLATLLALPLSGQELPTGAPEDVGMSSDRLDRLTVALQRDVDEGRLPGVVATVVRDGKVVYSKAVGLRDIEAGAPMTSDAIFRIASQTKAIVSVAIMML